MQWIYVSPMFVVRQFQMGKRGLTEEERGIVLLTSDLG